MQEKPRSSLTWILAAFLGAQLGLLWLHGALLNRQQAQLAQIHEDIQDLADAMDAQNNGDTGDQGGDGTDWAPARHGYRHGARHHARPLRARLQEEPPADKPKQEEEDPAMAQAKKDMDDTKKSNQDAVAKARERRSQLSLSENYRKGQEQREVQEAQYAWTRWVWVAVLGLLAVFGIRAYIKRNA